MKGISAIGLDLAKSEKVAEKLNVLLANYSYFYQNTRGFHWNIEGNVFFNLHEKFEELYNDLFEKIDEIAERILMLGFTPYHNFSAYAERSIILETEIVKDGKKAITEIIESLKIIILQEREILEMASTANDEGTVALMSDYIKDQEKQVWMYSAYMK